MAVTKNLTNQRFGKLTAVKPVGKDHRRNVIWELICDCGKIINRPAILLTSGKIKSCGCFHSQTTVNCAQCGTDFRVRKSELKSKKFHNRECYVKHQKEHPEKNPFFGKTHTAAFCDAQSNRMVTRMFTKQKNKKSYIQFLRKTLRSVVEKINTKNEHQKSRYVGYSAAELKNHLSNKFTMHMTWDNYGTYWEIDHIRPVSSFEKRAHPSDVNALKNLQPLLIKENNKKSDSYTQIKVIEQRAYTFDDVLLIPQYSEIKSRLDVNLSVQLSYNKKLELKIPIISAPMDTVTQSKLAEALANYGALGIIHRYQSLEARCLEVQKVKNKNKSNIVGIAVGLKDDVNAVVDAVLQYNIDALCFDIAHAHTEVSLNYIQKLKTLIVKKINTEYPIIAGNIATVGAALDLRNAGANIVKVGIGGGAVCSTRIITGAGIPMVSSVMEVRSVLEGFKDRPKIIADGGHRFPGDIAKSLAAGADAVMLGSLFAGTLECPGDIIEDNGKKYKIYRGMASKEAQEDWVGMKQGVVSEGVSTRIPYKGSVIDVLDFISGSLRSALSYGGSFTLEEFYNKSVFRVITVAGMAESHPHILT